MKVDRGSDSVSLALGDLPPGRLRHQRARAPDQYGGTRDRAPHTSQSGATAPNGRKARTARSQFGPIRLSIGDTLRRLKARALTPTTQRHAQNVECRFA